MNDIKAYMVMDKPKYGVWLPREISVYGSVSTANMELSINYSRVLLESTKKLRFRMVSFEKFIAIYGLP